MLLVELINVVIGISVLTETRVFGGRQSISGWTGAQK